MTTSTIQHPQIVLQDQWLAERKKLLAHEKELTRHRDRVNAERRRLPMVKIEKDYVFDGPKGKQRLKADAARSCHLARPACTRRCSGPIQSRSHCEKSQMKRVKSSFRSRPGRV
jgi:hypothetical protein